MQPSSREPPQRRNLAHHRRQPSLTERQLHRSQNIRIVAGKNRHDPAGIEAERFQTRRIQVAHAGHPQNGAGFRHPRQQCRHERTRGSAEFLLQARRAYFMYGAERQPTPGQKSIHMWIPERKHAKRLCGLDESGHLRSCFVP